MTVARRTDARKIVVHDLTRFFESYRASQLGKPFPFAMKVTSMTDNQPKCFDVIGPKAIAEVLRKLRNETNDPSDPCTALLSTNREPGVGAEMFAEWCEASEDGYGYKADATGDGVVISGEREITSRLVNGNGEIKNEKTEKQQLQPLFIARMHNNEAGVDVVEPLANERETENGAANIRESRSVLQIELSNRTNNTKPEQRIEDFKERQYDTYLAAGFSEAEASAASGFKPTKA